MSNIYIVNVHATESTTQYAVAADSIAQAKAFIAKNYITGRRASAQELLDLRREQVLDANAESLPMQGDMLTPNAAVQEAFGEPAV